MSYKLLALDMDGTLLNSRKEITPATLEAINRLISRGVHVILASGRCLQEVSDYREPLKNLRYSVLMSGGMVYDFAEEKPLALHPVAPDDVIEIIDAGLEERAMIHILTVRESVARAADISHMADFHMGVYQTMFERVCTKVDDIKQFALKNAGEVIKVNLYHLSPASRQRNAERLSRRNLEMVFAEGTSLEASPRGVSKASGLIELCRLIDIDIKETVAIGDAPNDLEILQAAGMGVVMGNADDKIKALAGFVTADNDHDGVAVAIEKFFPKE